MKLVIFGLVVSSAWANGHATSWRALIGALTERGHDLTFFERDQRYYAEHRDLRRLTGARLVLYRDWNSVERRALSAAARADVVITTSYCPGGAALQRALFGVRGPRHVFYDMDTPVTLEGLAAGDARVLDYLCAAHIAQFDLYLSFSSGPLLADLSTRWGARAVAPLHLCINAGMHGRGRRVARYAARLGCLATFAADRQPALEALLLAPARRMPGARFTLAGAQYPAGCDWPTNVARWEHVIPGEHAAFYRSSDFTLNLTRAAMRRAGYAPQGRLFEAASCGVPIISDDWPGLEEFFEPGREMVVARDTDDVCRTLRDFGGHRRRQMAWRARRRVLAEHSGARRAQQLEQILH